MDCDNTLWIDAVGLYTKLPKILIIEQTGQRGSKLHMAAPRERHRESCGGTQR